MVATDQELAAFHANLLSVPDFIINIKGYQWRVHSNVISRHSKYFMTACNGAFKESTEKSITLHDDCPYIVARMIKFMYTGNYSESGLMGAKLSGSNLETMMQQWTSLPGYQELKTLDSRRKGWEVQVLMYHVADKYGIQELVRLARDHLVSSVSREPNALAKVVECVGTTSLVNDRGFASRLLNAAIKESQEPSVVYKDMCGLLKEETSMIEMVHDVVINNFNIVSQENTILKASLNRVYKALTTDTLNELGPIINPLRSTLQSTLELRNEKARRILEESQAQWRL